MYKIEMMAEKSQVQSKYRRMVTPIPAPESKAIFETLKRCEPRALATQVPVVWDRAQGFQVYDPYGNCWIDFTSGILVANAGHSHPHVTKTLMEHIQNKPLHSYLFATEVRARLVEKLIEITPANLTKVFLLSTGTESVDCAIKLSRLYTMQKSETKTAIVSFENSFHGRTMGAQQLYSVKKYKTWITSPDPDIHHVPYPRCCDCPWGKECYDNCGQECFDNCLKKLKDDGVDLSRISSIFLEGYQGMRGPIFAPNDFAQALRKWCDSNDSLLIVDEIQSGFGRTGKLFSYQHYGIEADMVCCGKGISSSLPLSAVFGRDDIMDVPDHGHMTSTHTGNPLCCAAALASIEVLEMENLIEAAAEKGKLIAAEFEKIKQLYPDRVSMISGKGLVHAIFFVKAGTNEPDIELSVRVVEKCIEKGLMLFVTANGTIKICPPLSIPTEPLLEGIEVIAETLGQCLNEQI